MKRIEIEKNREEINNIWKEVSVLMNKGKTAMEKGIHDMVKEMGGELVIDEDIDEICGVGSLMIGYDGGNHPEYASSMYSIVSAIYSDDNDSFDVDLEEENGYEPYRMTYTDISEIYDVVYAYYKHKNQ